MSLLRPTYEQLVYKLDEVEKVKSNAYFERNQLVAALAKVCIAHGGYACLGRHPDSDTSWEDDWRTIVYMHFEQGQMSWHIHDSERYLFDFLAIDPDIQWDGHTTEEKYKRLADMTYGYC